MIKPGTPVTFYLHDGTHVLVSENDKHVYEFHITRLNSEKHNFIWEETSDDIEGYENRYDIYEREAIDIFKKLKHEHPN